MYRRIMFCLFFILSLQTALALAGENVLKFSSELLASESQQVLQPDHPFKYTDPKYGPALRKLMDPARAQLVIDEYFADKKKGIAMPDITNQIKPLMERYQKAFDSNPGEYEQEYLDALNWLTLIIQKSRNGLAAVPESTTSSMSEKERVALDSLQKSMNGLLDTVMKAIATDLLKKIESGKFTNAGIARAMMIVSRLSATVQSGGASGQAAVRETVKIPYGAMDDTQKMVFGERIFNANCAVCHGVNGHGQGDAMPGTSLIDAPSLSDAESALNAVMRGRKSMPNWTNVLDDDEIAAVINYTHDVFTKQSEALVSPDVVHGRRLQDQCSKKMPAC